MFNRSLNLPDIYPPPGQRQVEVDPYPPNGWVPPCPIQLREWLLAQVLHSPAPCRWRRI